MRAVDALSETRSGRLTNHNDVLGWFDGRRSWTVAELAAHMALSRSTVRRYLNDLADAGHLHRSGVGTVVYTRNNHRKDGTT